MTTKISEMTSADLPLSGDEEIELSIPGSPRATRKATAQDIANLAEGPADAMVFKGVIDASSNPNYPAANAGDVYKISVAGKIGGASGSNVEAGDTIYCITDVTSSGTQAAQGSHWVIVQANVDGAYFAGGTDVAVADGGTGASTASGARTNLGLAIGTDVQAHSAALDAVSGTNTGDQTITLTGDVTGSGTSSFVATLAARSTDGTMSANSATLVPSQSAVVSYVSSQLDGRSWKQDVKAATTTNGAITTAFIAAAVVDDVVLVAGDRLLIKNQTTASENGIYIVQTVGAPVRSTDADAGSELIAATVGVAEGTINANTQWTQTTTGTITLGSTSIVWTEISAGVVYTADETTLHLSGAQFSLKSGAVAIDTHAATSKSTPADADELPLVDSAASNVLKNVTWSNVKITLKAYFDTVYGSGTGDALTANPLSQFAATTSAQLAGVISDETGSGPLVFATSPAFTQAATFGSVANGAGTIGCAPSSSSTTTPGLTVTGGDNSSTGTGGALTLQGGDASAGKGGAVTIRAGNRTGGSGGSLNNVTLIGGACSTGSGAGSVSLVGGANTSTGSGGGVNMDGGGAINGSAGNVAFNGGQTTGTGPAGSVTFSGGISSGGGAPGAVTINTNGSDQLVINGDATWNIGGAPGAGTAGQVIKSGGAGAAPAWGAAGVVGGGTGVASLTAYAPIFGGTTSTGAVQSGTVGTSGQVLTSNGAGALPTFQAVPGSSVDDLQTFTADGTWTKPAGVTFVKVVCIGGGGGGGGGGGYAAGTRKDGGGGGGGGAYVERIFKAADLGATETIIVGTGGAAGTGGTTGSGTAGTTGGDSTFGGTKCAAFGGGGGGAGNTGASGIGGGSGGGSGGAGAVGTTGNVLGGVPAAIAAANGVAGQGGGSSLGNGNHAEYGGGGGGGAISGAGGSSIFGGSGGGCGGAISSGGSDFNAGDGGRTSGWGYGSGSGNAGAAKGAINGGTGTAGTAGTSLVAGGGGGGGGDNTGGTGGIGGVGGAVGGGGGGGGAGTPTGGAGAAGGRGEVRVYSW